MRSKKILRAGSFLLVLLLTCILPFNTVFAASAKAAGAPPEIEWAKCFGTVNSDVLTDLCLTKDLGFAATGYTPGATSGVFAGWAFKQDKDKNLLWEKKYQLQNKDNFGNNYDVNTNPYSITENDDGTFSLDGYVGKYDPRDGKNRFHYTLNASGGQKFTSRNPNPCRRYFSYGGIETYTDGDYAKIKTDAWEKSYYGYWTLFNSAYHTQDGGVLAAGTTNSDIEDFSQTHGGEDIFLIKYDAAGNTVWSKMLGGTGTEYIDIMLPTADGGFVIAAYTDSNNGDVSGNHGNQDAWIIKLDKEGNAAWSKCFGGSNNEIAESICETAAHGFAVACTSDSNDSDVSGNHGNGDYWVFGLDANGSLEWQKCFGGSEKDEPCAIKATNDGNLLVAGTVFSADGDVTGRLGASGTSDGWIFKLSAKPATQYTVSATPNKSAYGSVTGAGKYGAGAEAVLTAVPKSGYRFMRWLEGKKEIGKAYQYKFAVAKDRTFIAEFTAIGKPKLTKATAAGKGKIKLKWNSVSGAAGYTVYRSTKSGSGFKQIGEVKKPGYTDTGLKKGKKYYYKIKAFCTAGPVKTSGKYSNVKSAKPA